MDRLEFVWENISDTVRSSITEQTYATWFEPIRPVSITDFEITIEVPSKFYYEWIDSHYKNVILGAIKKETGNDVQLNFKIAGKNNGEQTNQKNQVKNILLSGKARDYDRGSKLSGRYVFNTFVEGPNNQFARAAALSVAKSPGQTSFNPLLIYGGVGLGKTHLMQAIGNQVLSKQINAKVKYTTSEKFTTDFVSAIKSNKTSEFSSRYRECDVLLLDDAQFLQKKEQTQEQFFHTFNELYQRGKQIVLTTDRHPSELYGLKDRLVSRFQSGLTVDIQKPNLETRIAILQSKAEQDSLDIPDEITEFIARNIKDNIRVMEGALVKLLAYSSLFHIPITLDLASKVLKETLGRDDIKVLNIEDIIRGVSGATNVSENKLISRGRTMEVAQARQIAMYLCRELVGTSLGDIGLHFGGRDHSTVIHACRNIEKKMAIDSTFNIKVQSVKSTMGA
ncbi:MAG TPA: chromosomal replication initiator protein DnaA [Candidatus Marinimicrobia bacterium]|nr:chromosomal replication initiator protein DnaA [Candidatus Neomarinimicrobiota bacterium]